VNATAFSGTLFVTVEPAEEETQNLTFAAGSESTTATSSTYAVGNVIEETDTAQSQNVTVTTAGTVTFTTKVFAGLTLTPIGEVQITIEPVTPT
jgi:hypothetical protein